MLAGSVYVGFYAFGDSSGEITDDESVQRLVHAGVEVASTGFLVAGAVGFAAVLWWPCCSPNGEPTARPAACRPAKRTV